MPYVMDTSDWINLWNRYPPDVPAFRPVWSKLQTMIDDGELISPDEVLRELEEGDNGLVDWLKQRPHCFRPLDDALQIATAAIVAQFPKLSDYEAPRGGADAFVVALAQITSGVVVANENPRKPGGKIKIPDACQSLGIRCIKLLDLLREIT